MIKKSLYSNLLWSAAACFALLLPSCKDQIIVTDIQSSEANVAGYCSTLTLVNKVRIIGRQAWYSYQFSYGVTGTNGATDNLVIHKRPEKIITFYPIVLSYDSALVFNINKHSSSQSNYFNWNLGNIMFIQPSEDVPNPTQYSVNGTKQLNCNAVHTAFIYNQNKGGYEKSSNGIKPAFDLVSYKLKKNEKVADYKKLMLAFVKLFNGTVVSTTANQVNLNISELAKAKLLVSSAIQAATATAGQTQVFSANDIKQAFPGQKIELIESNGKETKKIQFILSDELATFTAQLMNKSIEHSRE